MDNAFERARAAYGTGAYDDATLEFLFPQLKESEDERIRKEIISALKFANTSDGVYDKHIAWLERQKELFESGKGLYYYDGEKTTYCGYPATEDNPYDIAMSQQEKQKEHQNNSDAPNESSAGMISSSDKDKNLDEIAQDYIDGVKKYNPEPTWDLMQTAVCYGYHYYEQKEQKPRKFKLGDKIHWHDDDTNVITITGFRDDAYLTDSAYGPILFCDEDNWERIEWSEKDERMRKTIIRVLNDLGFEEYCKSSRDQDIAEDRLYYDEIKWLKSLRPSWKPSEEQMKALREVAYSLVGTGTQTDVYLVQLYEQLKKL